MGPYRDSNPLRLTILAAMSEDYTTAPQHLQTVHSRKLPESIQNAMSFDVIQVKNFKIFMERPSLVVVLCLCQWHIFQKLGISQQSRGCGHEKFPGGKPTDPHFRSLRSYLVSAPQYLFRSNGPDLYCRKRLIYASIPFNFFEYIHFRLAVS